MADTIISYDGDLRCRAERAETGIVVVTDAPKDLRGQDENFSPSDMLAIALGSCILSSMAIAARSMTGDIVGATATVMKEMTSGHRRFASLAVVVRIPGGFDERERTKLEAAAHGCPVHNVIGIDVPITIEWTG